MLFDLLRPLWRRLPIDIQARQRLQRRLFRTLPFLFRAHPGFQAYQQSRQRGTPWQPAAEATSLLATAPPESIPARLIAFYLPQFHPIPENDAWWGRGFTEWFNVVRARPQFPGHDQPRLPGELGFYDLRVPEVMARQVELAKLHGIGGFAFYHYWFDGKQLLERPLEQYLASDLDLPFCLCWANENWSRRWDGRDDQILIAQRHSPADDLAFIQSVAKYLRDPRYIRVKGAPLLLLYRPDLLPNAAATASRWRGWCRENGLGEIHLAYTQSFDSAPPAHYGFDSAVEFPPNNSHPVDITERIAGRAPDFAGRIYDWTVYPERSRRYAACDYRLFRGVNPGWDNEARRRGRGSIHFGATPAGYRQWLENAIADTLQRFSEPSERLVFINAWNEWAEGAYLEPDARHGYAYLQATRDALLRSRALTRRAILLVAHDAEPHGAQYLILRLAQRLGERFGYRISLVVLGAGPLLADYATVAEVHRLDEEEADRAPGRQLAQALRERGLTDAIVNSTASGRFLPSLSAAGFRTVTLVHELPDLIRRHALQDQARHIAALSDVVIFPARIVRDGFAQFAPLTPERCRIRPQGLYKPNRLIGRMTAGQARARLRERLGLAPADRILLGVGYGDHRKGIDLFVQSALAVLSQRPDVQAVWIGEVDALMRQRIDQLLGASTQRDRVHFPGRIEETDLFYAGADVLTMTSREDPFPSVVLESLAVGMPVVAFAKAGGFADLAPSGAVRLAPAFDTQAFAETLMAWLDDEPDRRRAGERGRALIARDFGFQRYVLDLLAETQVPAPRVSVIVPNFNYARYLPGRVRSILDQTLPCYELILLDDASTDASRHWLETELPALAPEAEVVLNAANSGSVFAQWLAGVERARGEFVWIAEADDLADPEFLQEAMRGLADPQVVMSFTQSRQIDPEGEVLSADYLDYVADISRERWSRPYVRSGLEEIREALAVKNTIPNVSAVVFRRGPLLRVLRGQLERIRGYRIAGDWVTYAELLKDGSIAFSPRALNDHRRHPASVTLANLNREQLREIRDVQRWIASEQEIAEETGVIAEAYLQGLYEQFGLATAEAPHYGEGLEP